MTLQPGQTVAHYQLLELIGEGGMGRVFRAHDSRLRRQVAIKILLPALTADEKLRRRFLREARAAAAVSHPAIAAVHEVGESGDATYIVMEFVEGHTLRRTIDGKPLPLSEALRVAVEIGEGLTEAHKAGVIHRDLKPDNIIIRPDRRPKILDFGIAKLLEEQSSLFRRRTTSASENSSLTGEGRIMGTLGYMSPEQARGEPVDARSDIFSFGVILYEMVAGQPPFRGRTPIDTLTSILKEPPPPVASFNPKVHPRVEAVLQECLDKDPEKRFQSMRDAVVALRIAQLAIQEAALRRTTTEQPALREPLPGPRRASASARPRSPFRPAAIGILAALAVLVAGFVYTRLTPRSPVEVPAGAGPAPISVAVVGIENLTDPADGDRLGRSLVGLITTDLAEHGGMRVASTAKVMSAVRKAGAAAGGGFDIALASEAARFAGAEIMLAGQVTASGDRLTLSAELVDVHSGDTVGSLEQETGSPGELMQLAGAIASGVRAQLGVVSPIPGGAAAFDLARALTSSTEAYSQFVAGETEMYQARWQEAIDHVRQAIAVDPTFALAYFRLATVLGWLGRAGEAREALEAGRPHVERLPARWQAIYGAASAATRGDDKAAFDALSALPADSDLPDLHYILGEIHTHRSRYHDLRKAREHFQKALDLDPAFRIVFTHLVAHLLDARDIEGARRLIDRYREESADAGALAEAEVELLFAEGDLEVALTLGEEAMNRGHGNLWMPLVTIYRYVGRPREAWELADRAFREETEIPGVAMMIRAVCASDLGRLGEAIEGYAAASDALTTSGAYGRYSAASHVARARILAATGDLEGAIAAARRALDADAWYAPGLFWLGRFQIDAGRIGEARATLASLRKVAGEAHSPSGAFWERLLQAEIHRQDGDLGKALQELGKTALLAPEHRSQEIEHMTHARVKAAFGDADGAVEAWRLCVEPRVQSVSEVNMVTPLPWYELARAEELAGNSGAAREQYRRFLRRWGRTDLPVASTRDASSRLEALDREAPAR